MSDNPFVDILHRMEEMDRRLHGMIRIGKISEVNPQRAQARFSDASVRSTDWLDWQEPGNGHNRTWTAPRVGQEAVMFSPSGEPGQGLLMPGSYNKQNKAPSSNPNEVVLASVGNARVSLLNGTLTVKSGGTTFEFGANGFKQTGGQMAHDGQNVGKTHTHKNVEPGGGNSGEPN
ncbi:phage baseplate assembly protein V [Phreatobacter sp. HK31-P]